MLEAALIMSQQVLKDYWDNQKLLLLALPIIMIAGKLDS